MDDRYDVIIAGTGPTGLTLANILGRHGVRTLVLERDPGLSTFPKALNLDDEFFRLLHALGLGEAIKAHAKYPISYDYVSPLGLRLAYVEGRYTEHNFPNRAAIFQPEFERILAEHALATGQVNIEFDRELVQFTDTGTGVAVVARNAAGEQFGYSAQYLVGADGAHSACRKLLGLRLDEVDKFDVRHVVIDVLDDIDPSPMALTKMGWRRNFFSMPAPNGRRFEFSLQPHETAEQLLDDDTLRRLFKPWRNYDELKVIRKVVHTFRSRIAPRFQQGRVFLAGDAAHLMPIFGSQGMNSGARDANNLGWKLVSVIRYGASPDILATYNEERWGAVLETIRMATTNGKLQRVKSIPMSLLRDLVFGMLRLVPPANRYFREMRYIPKPFLRSPLIVPGAERGRKEEVVGRLLPNPSVVASGQKVLLDDLLGYGFAVVGLGVSAQEAVALRPLAERLRANVVVLSSGPHVPAEDGSGVAQTAAPDGHITAVQPAVLADDRLAAVWQQYRGQWLLLRPDRVVAAAGRLDALKRAASALQEVLQAGPGTGRVNGTARDGERARTAA